MQESDFIPYSSVTRIQASRVLVLAPHPDDEVFACGGAIALHVSQGTPVDVVVLTDGTVYGDATARQLESTDAASVLGYGVPEFWGFPDRALVCSDALVERLVAKIAATSVDLVYAPSPWEIHPDHRQTQMLAVAAVRRSAPHVRLAFYEVGVPLKPNLLLNISSVLSVKDAAMRCFGSQLEHQNYVDHMQALNRFRTYTLPKQVQAAEAFWVLSARETDESVWRNLLVKASLGVGANKPVVEAGAVRPLSLRSESARAQDARLPVQASAADDVSVCVLIRTMGRASLQDAIDSVVAQSFPHWEIMVINASGKPLTGFSDLLSSQVALVLEPGCSLGRGAAANALLDAARGRYAVFLDDDDQLLPDHLEKLVSSLALNPSLVAAYCDVQATINSGDEGLDMQVHVFQQDFDWGRLQFQNYLPIHSVIFRLQAALSPVACRFDEGLELFEDWDFWLQLAAKGEFVRVPGISALYALSGSGGSGHAIEDSHLRLSSLRRLGERQLARWRDDDVVELINWQSQRALDLEQIKQEASSGVVQIEQASRTITDLSHALDEQRLEVARLEQVRLDSLQQVTDAQISVLAIGRTLHERHIEIDRLNQLVSLQTHQLDTVTQRLEVVSAQDSAQQQEIEKLGLLRSAHLDQIERLNAQLLTVSAHESALLQELEILELVRSTQLDQIERLNAQLLGLGAHELELLEQIEQLSTELAIVSTHETAQQHEIDQLGELRLAHMDQIEQLSTHERAQQHEIYKLGVLRLAHLQQIEGLNAQLLNMYESSSWRLTRPLRGVRRLLGWLGSQVPRRVLRNGFRAAKGEIRRHSLRGFLARLPHYWRHRKTYGAVLLSPLPKENPDLFKTLEPTVFERRLHPDLLAEKQPIDKSVSIVIPTFNAGLEFRWLLRKLQSQKGLRQLDIVIVDSGSQDETVAWAKEFGCRVVEITQAEFSHSHARNLGADHATTDYLIFMVQDAYPVGEYWAYGMLRYLLDHAESGLVAASCSEYSRSDSDMMYDSMIDTHYRFLGCHDQDRLGDYQGSDHMALRSRGQLSDVACLISRDIFGQYRYQGDYAEDLDLGIRLIKDGHRVAMLASVKVVHSHNRAAFYYLKRSYVDVIFLVGMFDDFLVPAVDSVQGLLAGIISCAQHVSSALPLLEVELTNAALGSVLSDWIADCRKQCGVLRLDGACDLGDKRLDAYVDSLRPRFDPAALDGLALSEARRFADSFFARLDHFNGFITGVYGAQDDLLKAGLREAICKTFAATAGSVLGFMYMDKLGSTQPDQYVVDLINDELRGGV